MKLVHAYSVKELRIYEPPADGEDYVIGADPSEGLTKSGDSDYACAQVLRCSDGKQVAAFRAKYDPKTFGELLDQLGRFFNDALLDDPLLSSRQCPELPAGVLCQRNLKSHRLVQ